MKHCSLRLDIALLLKTVKSSRMKQEQLRTLTTSAGAGGAVIASLCLLLGPGRGDSSPRYVINLRTVRRKLDVTVSDSSVTPRVSAAAGVQDGSRVAC